MPNARFFAPTFARQVSHALVCTAAVAFAVLLFTHARACPVSEPQPLRRLYMQSDRIVTARVGKSEAVKVEMLGEEGAQQTPFSYLKTSLLVSSTLKGEAEPVIYVNHTMYGDYKDALSQAEDDGGTLLLFLNRQSEEEGGGFFINEMSYGLKALPDAELKIYTKRIEELAAIMREKKPDEAAIVEWLVRCTEEPATRWEGAYDLWTSYNALQYAQQDRAETPENSEAVEETATREANPEANPETNATVDIEQVPEYFQIVPAYYDREGKFIQLLTPEQKNRLLLALLSIETLNGKDYPLIEVVKDWDDPRLVPYLLSQLKPRTDEEPYPPGELMLIVANKLGDKALIALAEKFRDSNSSEDMIEFPMDESSEAGVEEERGADNDSAGVEVTSREAAAEEARSQMIEQRRSAALQYFVTLAESIASGAATNVSATDQY